MLGALMIILPSAWFLAMIAILSTLLFNHISSLLTNPSNTTTSPYSAIPLVVGLGYLAFVALIAQDCFFPARTANMFKIHSAGPDKEERKWVGVDTRVDTRRVHI